MRTVHTIVFLCISFVLLTGCVSYTTLQTAEPLAPGSVNAGIGTAVIVDNSVGVWPEVGVRVGIFENADIGGKVSLGGLMFFDAKYKIIDGRIKVAADLGWSYTKWAGNNSTTNITSKGWYPSVIIGDDHWYAGIRGTHLSTSGEFEFFGTQKVNGSKWISTNLVIGGSIGDKFRFLPEMNIYFPSGGNIFVVPAIGFQFNYW